jgi:ribosomal protein L7/L12
VLRFLEDKFSEFTENEQLAIEEYKTNKISAVKFLMSESNYGFKQAKDFLDKHSIQTTKI